ncbi:hypothetical protein ACLIBG_05440 [Virgibacillus sp. W0181]|uniref:hypothetical protein n=1 Tax=Virgibacillus sp. W0181 TaxID=3391581 RepID=UPI003F45844B
MQKNKLDREMKKIFKKETDPATERKDVTWNRIENKLFSEQNIQVKRKTWRIAAATFMAVVIAVVWFGSVTSPGQSIMHTVRDIFVEDKDMKPEIEDEKDMEPETDNEEDFQIEKENFVKEKEMEIELEGMKEVIHTELKTNDDLRYIIYVDTSRYKFEKGEKSDAIVPKAPLGDEAPEVSMEIRQEERTVEETVAAIKKEIADEKMELYKEEEVTTPIEGTMLTSLGEPYTDENGITARHWDTPVHRYYVANQNGKVFVITQKIFVVAQEGHGVRFDSMLGSFEVIE